MKKYNKEALHMLLRNVKVLFSNVVNQDDFSDKYQIVAKLTEEQAADAEASGVTVKTKEYQGATQFQATFKTKFKPRVVGNIASKDFDLEGSEIGRGSEISIQYKHRDWKGPSGNTGVAQDLVAVQILNMESVNQMEFEDEGGLGADEEPSEF